ncbi:MAG: hypothetical protein MZU84_07380 [Sphingobacterium sp.]|nr:hypothetical protein [Sphingobacterium sp.]
MIYHFYEVDKPTNATYYTLYRSFATADNSTTVFQVQIGVRHDQRRVRHPRRSSRRKFSHRQLDELAKFRRYGTGLFRQRSQSRQQDPDSRRIDCHQKL